MPGLVTVVADDLASASSYHTTTTPTSKITSIGCTTTVTIAIIALALILYPIGVIRALSQEVITATLIFIMSYGLIELTVGVFGDLHIPLE